MASVLGATFARALDAVRSVTRNEAPLDSDSAPKVPADAAPSRAKPNSDTEKKLAGRGMIGKKSLPLRHRNMRVNETGSGKFKRDLRRVARRAGVKRFGGGVDEEAHAALRMFMTAVLRDTALYVEHARRKTVTAIDIVRALKRNNITLYGYGGHDDVISRGIGERAKWLARAQFKRKRFVENHDGSDVVSGSEEGQNVKHGTDGLPADLVQSDELIPSTATFDVIKLTISKLFSELRTDKLSKNIIAEALSREGSDCREMQPSLLNSNIQFVLNMLEEDNRIILNGDDVYLM